jgi:hypothetical protein
MELGLNQVVTIVIALLVVVCVAFLAMTVPDKANQLITTVDTFLADHGLDMGLIARATNFIANAEWDSATSTYRIKVSWTPTAKAEQDQPTYKVFDSYNPYVEGSRTDLTAIAETDAACTATEPNCACPSVTSPCILTSAKNSINGYGGQHKLTLRLYDKNTKKELNAQGYDYNFYSKTYVDNYNQDIQSSSFVAQFVGDPGRLPMYGLAPSLMYYTGLNSFKCKSKVVWDMAYENYWFYQENNYCICYTGAFDGTRKILADQARLLMSAALKDAGFSFNDLSPCTGSCIRPAAGIYNLGADCKADVTFWANPTSSPCHYATQAKEKINWDPPMIDVCPGGIAAIDKVFAKIVPIIILRGYADYYQADGVDKTQLINKAIYIYTACSDPLRTYLSTTLKWAELKGNEFPDRTAEAKAIIKATANSASFPSTYKEYLLGNPPIIT